MRDTIRCYNQFKEEIKETDIQETKTVEMNLQKKMQS